MKATTLLSFCIVGSICSAQINYETTGATVDSVVAELARQSGEKLVVDKDIANEIVVVAVEGVSVDEFKNRLADCVSGKWLKKRDGITELKLDAALSSARRRQAQQDIAKYARARISTTREIYANQFQTLKEGTWAQSMQITLDILEALPTSVFEAVLPYSTVVLSTSPNRRQMRLGDVSKIVEKYLPGIEAQSVKLSIYRSQHTPYLMSSLWITEADGKLHQASVLLMEMRKPVEKQPGKTIQWSAAAQELARNYRLIEASPDIGLMTISENLRDVLARPTQIDPISFGFGEGLVAIADDKKRNLIASASDDDISRQLGYGVSGTTTGDFWQLIKSKETFAFIEDDRWLIVRPKDPISARELRGSRIALEKIIGKAKGSVWVSLDDLVEFACSNLNCQMIPGAFSIPFGMMVSYNGTTNQGFESGYLRGLQFYGTLGMAQRERLRGGVELAVAQIPPKARGVLDKLFTETGRGNFYMNVEPTSALPDGVTPDLRIKGSISDGTLFRPLPDAGEATGPSRAKTAGDFAREKWIRLHDTEPDRITANEPVRVLIGSRSIWTFDVMDAHQILTTLLVADDRVPNGATPFLMDDLPENIKSELNRAYEQFVKTMGDGG